MCSKKRANNAAFNAVMRNEVLVCIGSVAPRPNLPFLMQAYKVAPEVAANDCQ